MIVRLTPPHTSHAQFHRVCVLNRRVRVLFEVEPCKSEGLSALDFIRRPSGSPAMFSASGTDKATYLLLRCP